MTLLAGLITLNAVSACLAVTLTREYDDPMVVATPSGPIRGKMVNDTMMWLGIPYAKPPVGDLRFRPPQIADSWSDIRNTTAYGPACMQYGSPELGGRWNRGAGWATLDVDPSSEDCLYANVLVPASANPSKPLPVMVYLHAGEFRFGTSQDAESDRLFANGSMILVTGNSRLGMLGFAALDSLRSRDPNNSTGNYGMQDQRLLLDWTRRSIAKFGGDPNRITMFGESSGGASVAFHLVSNRSQGKFDRAILESPGITQSKSWEHASTNTKVVGAVLAGGGSEGCTWPTEDQQWITFPDIEASTTPKFSVLRWVLFGGLEAAKTQCVEDDQCVMIVTYENETSKLLSGGNAGSMSSNCVLFHNVSAHAGFELPSNLTIRMLDDESTATCLLKASIQDLVSLVMAPVYGDTFFTDTVAPTEDGVELEMPLQTKVREFVPNGVDVMAGSNMDEGTEFMADTPSIKCNASVNDLKEWATLLLGADIAQQIPAAYPSLDQPTPLCPQHYFPSSHNVSDFNYMVAMRSAGDSAITCRVRNLLNKVSSTGSNAWWYYFTATPINSFNMEDIPYEGSFHGSEIPFVFGYQAELSSDGERRLSDAMQCYWASFAATGNPNSGDCVKALGLPSWPQIKEDSSAMVFSNTSVHSRSQLKKAPCDIFDQFP